MLLGNSLVQGQCSVSSSYGWTVELEILQREAIPEFTDCPWYYHYEVGYDYTITFTGNTNNRNFNANIYFNCTGGTGVDPYAALGSFSSTSSGSGATANKAKQYTVLEDQAYNYGSNPDCNEVGLADINCTLVQIDYWGSGIANGTIFCATGFALPIELRDFAATKSGHEVYLHWTTETETNNDFFTVERSRDGRIWEGVAQVTGAGNSNTATHYHWTDQDPHNGTSYYRLKQTDFDGSRSYSQTESVTFMSGATYSVYPTPVSEKLYVQYGETIEELWLMDQFGRNALYLPHPINVNGQVVLDLGEITNGLYFLHVKQPSATQVSKVIVQH